MLLLFIKSLTGNEIIKALCWTLVHSLWQGLLLAVAGALVILFTKKRVASVRYNLLSGLFVMFLMTACVTFTMQLNQTINQAGAATVAIAQAERQTASFSRDLQDTFRLFSDGFIQGFIYYFDKNAPIIVTLWFIVFVLRLVKILSGLSYIRHITHHQVSAPDDYWKQRLQELTSILEIRKPVVLMESAIIKVPVVVGWLRPVILVPFALLTQLSIQQLEAILLHELAHIKRRDYFVNLVQSFADTVFFFNPAVLWISALIREERENCCDDMAIAVTKSKVKFVDALVSFQEYNIDSAYAMAFPGRKNQLLNRVQRIIYNTNKSLDQTERACILSCCLVIGFLCVAIMPPNGSKAMSRGVPAGVSMVIDPGSVQQPNVVNKTAPTKTVTPIPRLISRSLPQHEFHAEMKPASSTNTAGQTGNLKTSKKHSIQFSDTIPFYYKEQQSSQQINAHADIDISVDGKIGLSYGSGIQDISGHGAVDMLLKKQKPLKDVLIKLAALPFTLNYNSQFTIDYKTDIHMKARPYNGSKAEPIVMPYPIQQ